MAGLSTLVVPGVGVVSAWIQLGERPSMLEAAGMALIGCALALLEPAQPQTESARSANLAVAADGEMARWFASTACRARDDGNGEQSPRNAFTGFRQSAAVAMPASASRASAAITAAFDGRLEPRRSLAACTMSSQASGPARLFQQPSCDAVVALHQRCEFDAQAGPHRPPPCRR